MYAVQLGASTVETGDDPVASANTPAFTQAVLDGWEPDTDAGYADYQAQWQAVHSGGLPDLIAAHPAYGALLAAFYVTLTNPELMTPAAILAYLSQPYGGFYAGAEPAVAALPVTTWNSYLAALARYAALALQDSVPGAYTTAVAQNPAAYGQAHAKITLAQLVPTAGPDGPFTTLQNVPGVAFNSGPSQWTFVPYDQLTSADTDAIAAQIGWSYTPGLQVDVFGFPLPSAAQPFPVPAFDTAGQPVYSPWFAQAQATVSPTAAPNTPLPPTYQAYFPSAPPYDPTDTSSNSGSAGGQGGPILATLPTDANGDPVTSTALIPATASPVLLPPSPSMPAPAVALVGGTPPASNAGLWLVGGLVGLWALSKVAR